MDWNKLRFETVECFASASIAKRNQIRKHLNLEENGRPIVYTLEELVMLTSYLCGIEVDDLIVEGLRTVAQRQISLRVTNPQGTTGVIGGGAKRIREFVENCEKLTGDTPSVAYVSTHLNTGYNTVKRWYIRHRSDCI